MDMNRRTFLRRTAGAALWVGAPAVVPHAEDAFRDDDLLARARERIAQHRQAAAVVAVRDGRGRPVPGATVRVEQLRHQFLFGCNFFNFEALPTTDQEDHYRQRFAALMNYATLGFYWPGYEPERGLPLYDYTDRVLDWTGPHGITCKGHPLVWDFADPKWLPRDFAEIRALSHGRVRDCITRFKDRIHFWDVVNEPTALGRFGTRLGEWAQSLGPVPYVKEHLQVARAAAPDATLLVNDYRTDPPYYRILDALRDDRRLMFDAIGVQSHMHAGTWPLARIWDVCDTYARLGRPIHFTETTVVSTLQRSGEKTWQPTSAEGEARQADYVPKFYTMLFGHPAVDAITWWDFSDYHAWMGAPAGLVRADMSPKPAYDRLRALVRGEWWTNTSGRTNASGEFTLRAFHGTHRITVESPVGHVVLQDVGWLRGTEHRTFVIV
jgi:GH35 family endo-1,4-beta-xylanase